jgi:alpha-L-fucosidase
MPRFIIAALFFAGLCAVAQQPTVGMDRRTQELKGLKWGMYLCWSFSSFSDRGWTPNVKDIALFNPQGCDTDQWARTAKEAGMGFICFLTKHHDGFCLWDTATSDRKVTKSPLNRDVLAELRKSCDKYGIKLALYYSEGEWLWPNKPNGTRYDYNGGYNPEIKKAQIKELLTQYGPIEFLWLDHAVGDGGLSHGETTEFCKKLQPGCFIGFSSGPAAGDLQIGEDGRPAPMNHHAVVCPYIENCSAPWNPSYKGYRVAEVLQPFFANPNVEWFYNSHMGDKGRSAEDLYGVVCGAVKYGNIFDLGVTPDRTGRLRDIEVKTLRRVGELLTNPPPKRISLATGKPAKASGCWRAEYDASKAVDGDTATSWAFSPLPGASANTRFALKCKDALSCRAWLEVDLEKPQQIGAVEIRERFSMPMCAIKKVDLEHRATETEDWKTVFDGGMISSGGYFGECTVTFPPVTARYVRLNIREASPVNDLVAIEEFHIWPPGAPEIRTSVATRINLGDKK